MNKECFSYIRFSSAKQAKGTSEDRQLLIAPRVAKEKGWIFREDLGIKNLGLSAYTGSNLKIIEGIIEAAEQGRIAKGTVMILEALDRLTRIPVDEAYQLFRRVIKSGVEIYTDRSNRHLTKDDLNNPMSLSMTVVELDAGYQYSDKLSDRVGKAWNLKKIFISKGNIAKHSCPLWLRHDGTKYTLIEERAKVVRMIFDLYNKGYGCVALIQELNKKGIKPFGRSKGWQPMTVYRMLESKSVIGYNEFVEPAIKGYYPPVISEDEFYKAQLQRQKNHSDRGRRGDIELSLYGGLCKCSYCGGSMVKYYVNGTGAQKSKKYTYLRCFNNKIGQCKSKMTRFEPFNETFLIIINSLEFIKLLFAKAPKKDNTEALQGHLANLNKTIERVADDVIKSDSPALVARLTQLEIDKKQLEKVLEAELGAKAAGQDTSAGYQQFIHKAYKKLKDPDFRMAMRALIRKHISMIICSPNEYHICLTNDNNLVSVTLNKPKMTPFGIAPSFSLDFGKWNPDENQLFANHKPSKAMPIYGKVLANDYN